MAYGMIRTVALSCEEADRQVRAALAEEGFGVLTEIDVKSTLKKKIDADIGKYVILGACNPRLAHQAILAEPDIGLLLPCNVVVREVADGQTVVEALDPVVQLALTGNQGLEALAADVRERLGRALDRVGSM